MRDIATAQLSGNLTRDVQLRALPSGADVARLRVAFSTRRRDGEEWVDKTSDATVDVFGAQARACAQHLATGSSVFVDAELDWQCGGRTPKAGGRLLMNGRTRDKLPRRRGQGR